jgi:excisionase family DNA binding protein
MSSDPSIDTCGILSVLAQHVDERTSRRNPTAGTQGSRKWKSERGEKRRNAWLGLGAVSRALPLNDELNVSSETLVAEPLLLTLHDAAQRLAVCRRTLERLIAAGEFPRPVKLGAASRVPLVDVQSYLAKLMRERGAS